MVVAGQSVAVMKEIDGFFFDLDGTLVDSARDLAAAVNRLRQHLGLEPIADQLALSFVGDGATRLVQRALPEGMYIPDHRATFLRLYAEHLLDHTCIYPGIEAFLDHHRDKVLAVVSNKPYALAMDLLRGLNLLDRFAVVLGGDSLAEKKPHPLPLTYAMSSLNVSPSRAVMIGDHHTDLYCAQAAGVDSCFCQYGFGTAAEAPYTWSVQHPQNLLALFP
ncbi:MAG: HAD family hydrolase [Desulfuromonas sp.]|nr:MAG: HAD family hydrolase [Desulfuromonas sp.]